MRITLSKWGIAIFQTIYVLEIGKIFNRPPTSPPVTTQLSRKNIQRTAKQMAKPNLSLWFKSAKDRGKCNEAYGLLKPSSERGSSFLPSKNVRKKRAKTNFWLKWKNQQDGLLVPAFLKANFIIIDQLLQRINIAGIVILKQFANVLHKNHFQHSFLLFLAILALRSKVRNPSHFSETLSGELNSLC